MTMERQPNTQYVLSYSYGKDSGATIHIVKDILHWPLDRIVTADVWATDTIPADLPEMWAWKAKADEIIYQRWGIPVEHFCAMCKPEKKAERERERESSLTNEYEMAKFKAMNLYFTEDLQGASLLEQSKDSQKPQVDGADTQPYLEKRCKVTYEDIFYSSLKPSTKTWQKYFGGGVQTTEHQNGKARIPGAEIRDLVQFQTQDSCLADSQYSTRTGAIPNSRSAQLGFPYTGMGWCHRLKIDTIRLSNPLGGGNGAVGFSKTGFSGSRLEPGAKINTVQYLGIAIDEPERVERHSKKNGIMLPMVEAGWTEAMAREWCEQNDLLAPTYKDSSRGGCWFCHNQGVPQLRKLRRKYPELWALLMKWDLDSPVTFHADGHTIHDFDNRFALEDAGLIDPNERFKWSMTEFCQLRMF